MRKHNIHNIFLFLSIRSSASGKTSRHGRTTLQYYIKTSKQQLVVRLTIHADGRPDMHAALKLHTICVHKLPRDKATAIMTGLGARGLSLEGFPQWTYSTTTLRIKYNTLNIIII